LASFCVWKKSPKCKDAVNRDFTIQSDVRRFCQQVRRISSSLSAVRMIEPSHPDAHLSTIPSVRTMCLTVRTAKTDQHHPSGRHDHSFRTLYCIEKGLSSLHPSGRFSSTSGRYTISRRVYPACIHPDVSAARPDASQYSISFRFLSKFQEREDQSTVQTMWYPVRMRVSLRQESQFKYHRQNV